MKIAVFGGGITGLTAAYYATKQGHKVTVFEKAPELGGLAVGFRGAGWDWPLERAYHHLFANDTDIINFAQEIGFDDIFFSSPHTDSLYSIEEKHKDIYKVFPVDTPGDFLRFPLLHPIDKIRGALGLAVLKFLPLFPYYESISAEAFVKKYMGEAMWQVFFKELFRKKYGKYAENILTSFLWARIHKRTKELGYIKGGFQGFIDYLEKKHQKAGVIIKKGYEITSITQEGARFCLDKDFFDAVISTLPSPVLARVAMHILPKEYLARIQELNYLHARVLVLETDKPLLDKTYWLNICTNKIPLMLVAQHTNFVDKKHYNNHHLAYVGYYLEREDPLMQMGLSEFKKKVTAALKKFVKTTYKIFEVYDFIGPFAQPIFDEKFVKNKPHFETPVENFYIANLDMTYPYDRGTNYAVKLGREVVEKIR